MDLKKNEFRYSVHFVIFIVCEIEVQDHFFVNGKKYAIATTFDSIVAEKTISFPYSSGDR
jgi:hypothetical protein